MSELSKSLADLAKGDHMLYVGGDKLPWRCPGPGGNEFCGCNVFRKLKPETDDLLYTCNACGTRGRAEE